MDVVSTGLGVITAVGILLTGIGTLRNNKHLKDVHAEVKTVNGQVKQTIGELISNTEERRMTDKGES